MGIFFDEHQRILALLIKHQVEFLLIGGYAVIFHGYSRTTGDMDIWLAPDNKNKLRLINALSEADFDSADLETLSTMNFEQHLVFSLGTKPTKIDFLTKINQVVFKDAFSQKIDADFDGFHVPIINLEDLVLSKFNTGRKKDVADIEALQKIVKGKKKK